MRFLASIKVRLFLVSWILFTVHFATNVVREHYPAFSLIETGTFAVDRYWGWHSDIFEHEGHYYVGNNVAACVIAAVPLLVFDPVLDLFEDYEKARNEKYGVPETVYETEHENSVKMMRAAQKAGLSLRLGASTVVTSAFLMAPLSAAMLLLMFSIMRERGRSEKEAAWLALVFGFSTPFFFRTGVLNHNMMLAYCNFIAFWLIWVRPGKDAPVSLRNRLVAGALCGFGLALDYSGVIPLLVFYGYLIVRRVPSAGWKTAIWESFAFVLGSVPPVLFLLYTQWAMFGNPFLPGQYWMPDTQSTPYHEAYTNPYSKMGFRGFTPPTPDLYLLNLFTPSYGMYAYGPLLALGLVPAWLVYRRKDIEKSLILDKAGWWFVAAFFFVFLTFNAANQYSRIQFNSGFRYLIPLVPLVFLQVADHLVRWPKVVLWVVLVPVTIHSWVISMVREPVPESWTHVLTHGPQFPWLHVLRSSIAAGNPLIGSPLFAVALMAFVGLVVWGIWVLGARAQAKLTA